MSAVKPVNQIFPTALPQRAMRGLELFNAGEYFEAHEELEAAWRAEPGAVRDLYQGILQVAVAYLHLTRGNLQGARKMFRRCRPKLDPLPAEVLGINIDKLRRDTMAIEKLINQPGFMLISGYDKNLLKPVEYRPD